jgi:hypothetical protein
MELSGQLHTAASLFPRERTMGARWIRGWVGWALGLTWDTVEKRKILHCQEPNPGHPACSLSLSYPNFVVCTKKKLKISLHIWSTNEEKYLEQIWRITLTPWSEFASELYRPSDCCLSAKWLPTSADRGCHVVSVTYPDGRINLKNAKRNDS